jgi:transcriptional regulator with XRE-family HTH domain
MPVPSAFGRRLKQVRETRGLSQAELANRASVPVVMISHFETGVRSSASAATLVKLANALSVSIDYLLSQSNDPAPVGGRVGVLLRTLGQSASDETINTVVTIAETLALQDAAKQRDRSAADTSAGAQDRRAGGKKKGESNR